MNFLFYWTSKGKEKQIRIDRQSESEAREAFKELYPRAKLNKVVNVTHLVKNLGLQLY